MHLSAPRLPSRTSPRRRHAPAEEAVVDRRQPGVPQSQPHRCHLERHPLARVLGRVLLGWYPPRTRGKAVDVARAVRLHRTSRGSCPIEHPSLGQLPSSISMTSKATGAASGSRRSRLSTRRFRRTSGAAATFMTRVARADARCSVGRRDVRPSAAGSGRARRVGSCGRDRAPVARQPAKSSGAFSGASGIAGAPGGRTTRRLRPSGVLDDHRPASAAPRPERSIGDDASTRRWAERRSSNGAAVEAEACARTGGSDGATDGRDMGHHRVRVKTERRKARRGSVW